MLKFVKHFGELEHVINANAIITPICFRTCFTWWSTLCGGLFLKNNFTIFHHIQCIEWITIPCTTILLHWQASLWASCFLFQPSGLDVHPPMNHVPSSGQIWVPPHHLQRKAQRHLRWPHCRWASSGFVCCRLMTKFQSMSSATSNTVGSARS